LRGCGGLVDVAVRLHQLHDVEQATREPDNEECYSIWTMTLSQEFADQGGDWRGS